jgi:hypothetical protein
VAANERINDLIQRADADGSRATNRIEEAAGIAVYALGGLRILAEEIDALGDRLRQLEESITGSQTAEDSELKALRKELAKLRKAVTTKK